MNRVAENFSVISKEKEVISFATIPKPVVLIFWASWCQFCQQEVPIISTLQKEFPAVHFVGIIYNDRPENVENFVNLNGVKFPSYFDPSGKVAKTYGIDSVPQYFIIDNGGKIRLHYRGTGFSKNKAVHKTLEKLTDGGRAFGGK